MPAKSFIKNGTAAIQSFKRALKALSSIVWQKKTPDFGLDLG
jgi:hypothetical protein